MTPELTLVVSMGLLGSAHCIGMCGGFSVLAHAQNGLASTMTWLVGKAVTYIVLGVIAGAVGYLFMGIRGAQFGLTVLVGLLLVALGLAAAGVIPDRLPLVGSIGPAIGRLMGRVVGSGRKGPFLLGLVNGLLPCGLVYAALAHATSTGSAMQGGVVMAAFGAATVPSLALIGWVSGRFGPAVLKLVSKAGGWLVVALGLMTLWRAWMSVQAHGMSMH